MDEKKLVKHIKFAALVLLASFIWSAISLALELSGQKSTGWFSKSGAILVVAALWLGQITRSIVEAHTVPDFVKKFELGLSDASEIKPEEHWALKYKVANKLLVIELIFTFLGTIIWAYSDTWLAYFRAT